MRQFNKIIGLIVVFSLILSLFTTAFAGYYQDQYAAAEARGDTAGMEAAHAGAVAAGTSNQPDRPVTVKAQDPPSGYSREKDNSNPSDFSIKAPSVLTPAVDTNIDYQSKINAAMNQVPPDTQSAAYYEQCRNVKIIVSGSKEPMTTNYASQYTVGSTVGGQNQDYNSLLKSGAITEQLLKDICAKEGVAPTAANLTAAFNKLQNTFYVDGSGYKNSNGDTVMTEAGKSYYLDDNGNWHTRNNDISDPNALTLQPEQLNKIYELKVAYDKALKAGDQAAMDAAHDAAEAYRSGLGYTQGTTGGFFATVPSGTGSGTGSGTVQASYTITSAAGPGGSISPAGVTSVVIGGSQTYTITANANYEIQAFRIDGKIYAPQSTFTFTNVTSNHTIDVAFLDVTELKITGNIAGLKDGIIKSGYGIAVILDIGVPDCTVTSATAEFTNGDVYPMEQVGDKVVFKVNPTSHIGARKYYIPVETKDGPFGIRWTVSAYRNSDPSKKIITATKDTYITIKGSMYEDDFTGDR